MVVIPRAKNSLTVGGLPLPCPFGFLTVLELNLEPN